MNTLSKWIRTVHRWLAIPFVIGVVLGVFSSSSSSNTESPSWQVVILIASLLSLLITGLYMFVQYYLRKFRRTRSPATNLGKSSEN